MRIFIVHELPIGYEFKISIRRNEWDDPFIFKFWESDTLVKLDIVKFNWPGLGRSSLGFEERFVIETEFEFRHSGEHTFNFDISNNFAFDYVPLPSDEHVEFLDNIKEDFVFFVFNSFRSPGDNIGDRSDNIEVCLILFFILML